jgi:hypothetical protein
MEIDISSFGHSTERLVGNLIWCQLMTSSPEIVSEIFSCMYEVRRGSSVFENAINRK